MKILRKYKSAFERQNNEPARIKISKTAENLNSKLEWNAQNIQRIRIVPLGSQWPIGPSSENIVSTVQSGDNIIVHNNTLNSGKKKAGRPKGSMNKKTLLREKVPANQ